MEPYQWMLKQLDTETSAQASAIAKINDAIANARTDGVVEPLTGLLDDPSVYVRKMVVEAIGEELDPRRAHAVDRQRGGHEDKRRRPIDAAQREQTIEPLLGALKDSDSDVRCAAAEVLSNLDGSRVIKCLLVSLIDPDPVVRGKTAESLGKICDRRAVEAPSKTSIPDFTHQRPTRALEAAERPEELPVLRARLHLTRGEEDDDVRSRIRAACASLVREWCAAINASGIDGNVPAIEPLSIALTDADSDIRQEAAVALGRIGQREALPALKGRLRFVGGERDTSVRLHVTAAIAMIEAATAATAGRPRAAGEAPTPDGRPRAVKEALTLEEQI